MSYSLTVNNRTSIQTREKNIGKKKKDYVLESQSSLDLQDTTSHNSCQHWSKFSKLREQSTCRFQCDMLFISVTIFIMWLGKIK